MEIRLKHGEIAVIDDDDEIVVRGYRWRLNCDGYAVSHRMVGSTVETVFMHRLINATPEDAITDHIDQDRLNNRRGNLRTTTKSLNALNGKVPTTNSSGYRGVSRVKHCSLRPWRAAIVINGRQEHLGNFADPADASMAYEKRRAECLNI